MILRLSLQQVDLLKKETERVLPIEACAMLFGKLTPKEAVVKKVMVTKNRLQSTLRFEIDPQTFAYAVAEADREGLDFIGLFHSHPAPAAPSSTDLKYMKLWGEAVWLILSSTNGKLAAYQMKNDRLREIILNICVRYTKQLM